MRDEIIGHDGQDALENIGRVPMPALFEQGFAQHPVGVQVLGVEAQYVPAVRDDLIDLLALDQVI